MSAVRYVLCIAFVLSVSPARGAETEPKELTRQAVEAVGGQEKLLKIFRIRERLNVSSDSTKPGSERVSILNPPDKWWVGKKERVAEDKEPAIFLVWAWTLGILQDERSTVEAVPEITDGDRNLSGLRVSGTVTPPMELYFDKNDSLLVRIDWRNDIHRFSDWRDYDGTKYPAQCIGYKKGTNKPWYFTEILELERLNQIPDGLRE